VLPTRTKSDLAKHGRRPRWAILVVLAGVLGALGCEKKEDSSSEKPPAKAAVVLWKLEPTPFVETRSFFGEVRATSDARLSAAEAGRVTRVHVVEGAAVKQGQVLVELDDQLARVQLNQALANRQQTQARSDQAKVEVEMFTLMRQEQIVSELETMQKKSEAASLSAAFEGESARVARETEFLRRHRIVAPFAGTVAQRSVDPGDWLNAGEMAIQLLTSGHAEINVRVPAKVLAALPELKSVMIRDGDRHVPARVDSSVRALDPATRTALLRIIPTEEAPWLIVGDGVYIDLALERKSGFNVPRDAIVYGVAAPRVYRVLEGKATPIDVSVKATVGDRALVESSELQFGDQLVIRGNERLRPGQLVTEEGALVPRETAP
jgi:RND family efflux transporter MFP subunit